MEGPPHARAQEERTTASGAAGGSDMGEVGSSVGTSLRGWALRQTQEVDGQKFLGQKGLGPTARPLAGSCNLEVIGTKGLGGLEPSMVVG